MEKSVGEDPSLALRMTRRTGSEWQGIPGRAGNDGGESSGKGEGRPMKGSPGENRMNKRK